MFNSLHQALFVCSKPILRTIAPSLTATRNTYILKRRYPVRLSKIGGGPIKMRGKNFVYDLEENTEMIKQQPISVILRQNIEGLGNEGDVVSVKKSTGYNKLLLPGLADYATPEAIERAKEKAKISTSERFSSPTAPKTVSFLRRLVLNITLNKENEWTLEPWHVRSAFRKAGVVVPEKAITMPKYQIKGPDLSLENKEFVVYVTVNGKERTAVRCRIHHWSTVISDRLPYIKLPWTQERDPLDVNEAEVLKTLPLPSHQAPPPAKF